MSSDFLQQLRATFMVEAQEHLQTMSHGFLALEKQTDPVALRTTLQNVFRAAHSLKGAARAVELNDFESLCQSLEDIFAGWRERAAQPPAEAMDVLHRSLDLMAAMLEAQIEGAPGPFSGGKAEEQRAGPAFPELPVLRKALRRFAKPPTPGLPPAAVPLRPGVIQAPPPFAPLTGDAPVAHGLRDAWPVEQEPLPRMDRSAPEQADTVAWRTLPRAEPVYEPRATEAERTAAAPPLAGAATAGAATTTSGASTGAALNTVRIALPKLASQLLGAEEMVSAKLSAGQRVADVRLFAEWLADWRKGWSTLESEARRLRQPAQAHAHGSAAEAPSAELLRVLDFVDRSADAVRAMEGRVADMARAVRHDRDTVGKLVDDLLDSTKQLLLLPFSTITASFSKLVRDLCRYQDKQAELVITGEQIEIDKLILEEIKDPLVHMLRNAVDHAVELPLVRERQGKPSRATITLQVRHIEGNKLEILLADDGAGIAHERVRDAALRLGVLGAEEAQRSDREALLGLVFRPELSTSAAVTRVSGRGLGLAIVQERARKLGGDVTVQSEVGVGTTFRIALPAGRTTFRGVLCEAGGQQFLISTTAVDRVMRVRQDAVRSIEGRETLSVGSRVVGVVRLATALEMDVPEAAVPPSPDASLQLVLIGTAEQGIAFQVDAVLDEQEVLVKPLRRPLCRVRNVAAAAVLGSGKVVPILNVADLLVSARRAAGRASAAGPAPARPGGPARSILLAEDSITSRMLLKSILMSAGYVVKTAVDGLEAYTMLRTDTFDMLVSDVEMPRLNGFDLTARVRADKKLRDLPVILVTALATRADRERGVDAGANAYIVKGSFDQNNLIATVKQLL